jgi:hypothetical protein
MKRRLLVLALLPALLDPLAIFARALASGERECRDHVCLCARRCPPKTSGGDHCQGSARGASSLRGACHHDQARSLGSATPAVLPVLPSAAMVPTSGFEPPVVVEGLPAGFVRIDGPPPRAL